MAKIFRSDAPRVGDRVTVRRTFQVDGKTTHSDVIGHVTHLNPLRVRPQMVGGYPSAAPEIEIPVDQVGIVKRLSPRTVRNSEIRNLELAYAKAFPGIEHTWTKDGQWLMRAGDGITERSNSATPLGPSAGFSPVPVEEIREFYARHRLPAQIQLPERLGRAAEKLPLELGPEILVMTRDLDALPAPDAGLEFRITDQPDADWLALYHFRGQDLPPQALEFLRARIDGHMGFGSLRSLEGETVAITRATLTEDAAGNTWLGYSAVEVAPAWRRRGLGTALGLHLLAWGKAHGAQGAYLQVLASNAAGIGLYDKLGFVEHHRHRYARL